MTVVLMSTSTALRPAALRLRPAALAVALLLLASPGAAAGDGPFFLYGLNQRGKLSVGGTVLESLPGSFDPSDDQDPNGEHRWTDLAVSGSDRWALRLDGRLHKNGEKIATFPFDFDFDAQWLRMSVADGVAHALRTDGLIHAETGMVASYPKGSSFFADLVALPADGEGTGPDVFALRFDGLIFTAGGADPAGRFQAGPSAIDPNGDDPPGPSVDGEATHTLWVRMKVDPISGDLVGLRSDGQVHAISIADLDLPGEGTEIPVGEEVATFPFPDTVGDLGTDDLFVDLEFAPDGTFFLIAVDGRVYTQADLNDALVDLPGSGLVDDEAFVDVMTFDGDVYGLRFDGSVFRNDEIDEPLVTLPNSRYVRIAASDVPPNLDSFDNRQPVASVYKTRLVEGQAAMVPIVVTDVDKAASELVITADFTALPGGTLELGTVPPHFTVPGDLPAGKYSVELTIDDGVAEKPKVVKYPVKVVAADVDPEKNKKPAPSKVKKVQALVGFELIVPLLTADPDGDVLTITPVTDKGAFLLGATFDDVTGTFTWTPAFEHLGKTTAQFQVSDGIKTQKLKLKLEVVNPLIFVAP